MTTRPRSATLTALACLAALSLSGCGGDDAGPRSAAPTSATPTPAPAAVEQAARATCMDLLRAQERNSAGRPGQFALLDVKFQGPFLEGYAPGHPPVTVYNATADYSTQPTGSRDAQRMAPQSYTRTCTYTPAHGDSRAKAEWGPNRHR